MESTRSSLNGIFVGVVSLFDSLDLRERGAADRTLHIVYLLLARLGSELVSSNVEGHVISITQFRFMMHEMGN